MLLIGIIQSLIWSGLVLLYWFIFHEGDSQENAYGAVQPYVGMNQEVKTDKQVSEPSACIIGSISTDISLNPSF